MEQDHFFTVQAINPHFHYFHIGLGEEGSRGTSGDLAAGVALSGGARLAAGQARNHYAYTPPSQPEQH